MHYLASLLALVLTGCAAGRPAVIMMKNPRTDQVTPCQGDAWRDWNPWTVAEDCARALEGDGWKRLTPKE